MLTRIVTVWNDLHPQGKIYVVCTAIYFLLMLVFLFAFFYKIDRLIQVMTEIKNKLP